MIVGEGVEWGEGICLILCVLETIVWTDNAREGLRAMEQLTGCVELGRKGCSCVYRSQAYLPSLVCCEYRQDCVRITGLLSLDGSLNPQFPLLHLHPPLFFVTPITPGVGNRMCTKPSSRSQLGPPRAF